MKRNRESRCRMKLIQEMHLNKREQRILDEAAAKTSDGYAGFYFHHRKGNFYSYRAVIATVRAAEAFASTGAAICDLAEMTNRLIEAANYNPVENET